MAVAFCCRSGIITVGRRTPKGMKRLARGARADTLMSAVQGNARLAYDSKTWLVPGVPEAESERDAMIAAEAFGQRLQRAVGRLLLEGRE